MPEKLLQSSSAISRAKFFALMGIVTTILKRHLRQVLLVENRSQIAIQYIGRLVKDYRLQFVKSLQMLEGGNLSIVIQK
jgi:hypothetical protein